MRFLEAENLSKTYIRRVKPKDGGLSRLWKRDTQVINALQNASFSVDEGELVAVMMAAVAEESGMPMGSFAITNVAPVAAAPVAAAPVAAPAPAAAPVAAPAAPVAAAEGETAVNSPMPGNIFKVECKVGQSVNAGDVLIVLEAMKMEIEVSAPCAGTVKAIAVNVGGTVNTDDLLVTIG